MHFSQPPAPESLIVAPFQTPPEVPAWSQMLYLICMIILEVCVGSAGVFVADSRELQKPSETERILMAILASCKSLLRIQNVFLGGGGRELQHSNLASEIRINYNF